MKHGKKYIIKPHLHKKRATKKDVFIENVKTHDVKTKKLHNNIWSFNLYEGSDRAIIIIRSAIKIIT